MADLKRVLGTTALTFYGVGVILGAGIYTIIGAAAGLAGDSLWVAFSIAAAAALLTGLSYAEMATMFPRAGAEYVYLRNALPGHRWAAAAVAYVLAGASIAAAATVSLAFAGYLSALVGHPMWFSAIALIGAATALNLIGVRHASWTNVAFTVVEAGGLVVFIVLGALQPAFGEALLSAPGTGVVAAASLVFFAFLGFEDIANLAEEAKTPHESVPRALLMAIGVATVVYGLVALAAVALVSPEDLARSEAPLQDALRGVSPELAGMVGGIALFATANTALVVLIVASRMILGAARGGDLPPVLSRVSGRGTPWVAGLVSGVLALALLPLGRPAVVGALASFCSLVAFIAVNASVVVLRRRRPEADRPFRVPGAIGAVPILPLLGILTCALLISRLEPWVLVAGASLIACAAATRVAVLRLRRPARSPSSPRA